MSEMYRVSTENVRKAFTGGFGHYEDLAKEWFEEWLNSVKAEAWDEAVNDTFRHCEENPHWVPYDIEHRNPYRTGGSE